MSCNPHIISRCLGVLCPRILVVQNYLGRHRINVAIRNFE